MFRSGLLKTQRLQYKTLNGDNRPDYIYNGILDVAGYRGHGLYGDNNTQVINISCKYNNNVNNAQCCGADSYGNPFNCSFYSIIPVTGSNGFRQRYVDEGYVITTNGSRYFGFKQITTNGGAGPYEAYPCNTCNGNQATSTAFYNANGNFGTEFILGIKHDGSLWSWGYNQDGQLGQNNTTANSIVTQVGSDTNWQKVLSSVNFVIALKSNGTLWAWGDNGNGYLGDGTTVNRSSPVQIGSGTNWKDISVARYHTLALKYDGTLWAWGYNPWGNLGDNSTTSRSSPVQVGSDTNWKHIMARYYSSHALKDDNTMWCWGENGTYALGLGDTANRSNPVQLGSKTWKPFIAPPRNDARVAIDTDSKMWTWGNSPPGVSNVGYRISPIQIGSAVDHVSIPEHAFNNCGFINTSGSVERYEGYDTTRTVLYNHFGNKQVELRYGTAIDYQLGGAGGTTYMLKSGHRPY